MDINEFAKILHAEVVDFQKFYIEQSKLDPDNFPSDLEENDWLNQVDSYNSIMMDKEDDLE